MIENRKFHKKASEETQDTAEKHSEAESLISSLKSVSSINTVSFTKTQYSCKYSRTCARRCTQILCTWEQYITSGHNLRTS